MSLILTNKGQRLKRKTEHKRKRIRKRRRSREGGLEDRTSAIAKSRQGRLKPLRTNGESNRRILDDDERLYRTDDNATYEPIELAAVADFDGDHRTGQSYMSLEEGFGVSQFPALLDENIFNDMGLGNTDFGIDI